MRIRFFGLRVLCLLALLTSVLPLARTQTLVNLRLQGKDVDFTGAPYTKPVRAGAQLPAACTLGELFFLTGGQPGRNLYACTSLNTWTGLGSGDPVAGQGITTAGSVVAVDDAVVPQYLTGSAPPAISCKPGRDFFLDNSAGGIYFCQAPDTWQQVSLPGHTHVATDITSGTVSLGIGGTNQSLWIAGRCVQVSADGTKLESAGAACGTGTGGTGATGNVTGPATSTDHAVARFAGANGTVVASTGITIDDNNNLSAPGSMNTGTGATEGEIRLMEQSANGTDFVSLKAPAARSTTLTVTLPATDPANGQVLRFASPASGVSGTAFSDAPGIGTCAAGQFVSGLTANAPPTCSTPVGGGGGSGGTSIGRQSATLDFPAISDGACAEQTFSFSGITAGSSLVAGTPASLEAGLILSLRASASDTVAVRLCNLSGAALDPAPAVYTATIANYYLTGSSAIDFASLPDGACSERQFTLTGATAADAVAPGWPATLEAGLLGSMRVSAADTISVRLCNLSGAALDPANQTFKATIAK
jgi:hypothetical protein